MSGGKPSKVEHVKRASSHLRGTIRQELDRPSTHFSEEDYQLLKFHELAPILRAHAEAPAT